MTWSVSIAFAVACLSLHILSVKFLGDKLPSSFVTPAFYVFALISLLAIAFFEKPKVDMAEISTLAILLPLVVAGVTIGLTDFFFVKSLNLGAQASTAMPIMLGGASVVVAILAAIIFKEVVNLQKMLGIVFAVLGIYLIHRSS